jgi:hypothetical protein
MYVIIAPIQIKPGFKEPFIAAVTEDAQGSVRDEPGCLRFDVIQDANDATASGSMKCIKTRRRPKPTRKRPTSSSFAIPSRTGALRDRRGQAGERPTSGLQIVNGNDLTRELSS